MTNRCVQNHRSNRRFTHQFLQFLIVACVACLLASDDRALGGIRIWTGANGDQKWETAGNWIDENGNAANAAPGINDDVIIPGNQGVIRTDGTLKQIKSLDMLPSATGTLLELLTVTQVLGTDAVGKRNVLITATHNVVVDKSSSIRGITAANTGPVEEGGSVKLTSTLGSITIHGLIFGGQGPSTATGNAYFLMQGGSVELTATEQEANAVQVGRVTVTATGLLKGGRGGNGRVSQLNSSGQSFTHGGAGGAVLVIAKTVVNQGVIKGGKAGKQTKGNSTIILGDLTGNTHCAKGGGIRFEATGTADENDPDAGWCIVTGKGLAGKGGIAGNAPGTRKPGLDGKVIVLGKSRLNGATFQGDKLVINGKEQNLQLKAEGPGAPLIELTNLETGAIVANNGICIDAGSDGVVDLTGSAADAIQSLDEGITVVAATILPSDSKLGIVFDPEAILSNVPCTNPVNCTADLNGDGVVGPADLGQLLAAWGPCDDQEQCLADLFPAPDGDGDVNPGDLAVLLSQWGTCPTCPDVTGSCLEEHFDPCCDDAGCGSVVCETDPFCCETSWDSQCVAAAEIVCSYLIVPACGAPNLADCCKEGTGPFCNDLDCCSQVCAADPFCCETWWDNLCVGAAQASCAICAGCGGAGTSDCLIVHETAFCSDADCCTFVCDIDPACCDSAWNEICVSLATYCGGTLPVCGDNKTGDCCAVHLTPACSDADCCGLVCVEDPYCCSVSWDESCRDTAIIVCAPCQVAGCAAEGAGPCTEAHPTPFCDNSDCCQGICNLDPFCCESSWDELCADMATAFCDSPVLCGAGNPNDCCVPNATPGCSDAACCEAVCAADPFCCETQWDDICADQAETICGLNCPGPCGLSANDCCLPGSGPGCSNTICCDAVCASDPFCCDVEWDDVCASQAQADPNCRCEGKLSNCCFANGGLGCDDAACQACVCAIAPFCCEIAWDRLCAGQAANECAPSCPCD